MKVSVSYLSSIFDKKNTIRLIDKSSADFIHVDLMDGKFVPKNNFEIKNVLNDLKDTKKPLDIHLMVLNPKRYIDDLSKLNPEYITINLESNNIEETIKLIKSKNIKVGISIKPNTDISYLEPYYNEIDLILVMTVEPGAGGQRFLFDMLKKIEDLNNIRNSNGYKYLISVDGGINEYTAYKVKKSGGDILVSGSFVCHHEDFDERINLLRK